MRSTPRRETGDLQLECEDWLHRRAGAVRIAVVTVGPRARTPIVSHRHRHAVAADGGSPGRSCALHWWLPCSPFNQIAITYKAQSCHAKCPSVSTYSPVPTARECRVAVTFLVTSKYQLIHRGSPRPLGTPHLIPRAAGLKEEKVGARACLSAALRCQATFWPQYPALCHVNILRLLWRLSSRHATIQR